MAGLGHEHVLPGWSRQKVSDRHAVGIPGTEQGVLLPIGQDDEVTLPGMDRLTALQSYFARTLEHGVKDHELFGLRA